MPAPKEQAQAYYADGKPIPDSELSSAIREGTAHYLEGSSVSVTDPYGVQTTVSPEQVTDLLSRGWKVEGAGKMLRREEAQQYETLPAAGLAAAEGLGRGLTLGLSDVAAVELGGEGYRRAAEGRQRHNPHLAGAAELTGAVAPFLLPGGALTRALGAPTRAASEAGMLAERGIAKGLTALGAEEGGLLVKGASMAGGGALEGTLWGTGSTIGQSYLEDSELTAEKLVSGMTHGALWGAGAGGMLGVASGAGRALREAGPLELPSMGKMLPEGGLREFAANTAEFRAKKAASGNYQKGFNRLEKKGIGTAQLLENPRYAEALHSPHELARVAGEEMATAVRSMDDVAQAMTERGAQAPVEKFIAKADEMMARFEGRDSVVAKKARNAIRKHVDQLRANVLPESAWMREATGGAPAPPSKNYSFRDWWQWRKDLDEAIDWAKRDGLKTNEKALRDLRKEADGLLDETIKKHGDEGMLEQWTSAKKQYSDGIAIRDTAQEYAQARDKNRQFSLTDCIAGAAGISGAMATGNVLPMALPIANKLMRERGDAWLAKLAHRMAKSEKALDGAAKAFALGKKAAPPLKLKPQPAARRVAGRGAGLAGAATGTALKKAFEQRRAEVKAVLQNPEVASQRLGETLGPIGDERLRDAVAAQAVKVNDYLASTLPEPYSREEASLTPFVEPAFVQPAEMRRWLKVADALNDVMGTIERIASGEVDLDEVEAVKQTNPRLWEDLQRRVLEQMAAAEEPLPFKRRMMTGLVFDLVSDPSLEPETAFMLQESQRPAEPPPEQGPPPQGPQLSPAFSTSLQTTTQKIATG